jgi:sensor domain CHASE-containing protein
MNETMSNAQKVLVMAVGIFLAIALITIAVVMFISAQEATKAAQNNFSNTQTELS